MQCKLGRECRRKLGCDEGTILQCRELGCDESYTTMYQEGTILQ
jgi:hypothetical protein